MRSIILFVLLFLGLGITQAQKKQNVFFLKNSGKHVYSKDSADFIRVIQEPDSGTTDFILVEQYVNGKVKTRGFVSKFDPVLVYEGQLIKYRDNGNKESLTVYSKGEPVGKGYCFFNDGKINSVMNYDSVSTFFPKLMPYDFRMTPYRLEYYADSLGTVLVTGGKGHFKEHKKKSNGEDLIEEGDYVNGLKEGLWTETNASGTYWFKEKFLRGAFLSGESFKDGQTYFYSVENEIPAFKGGMERFYKYLSKKVRYPADAQRAKISGKVFLSFVVEKDGSLTEVNVDRGVSHSIDLEAVRVLKQSPNWIPGKQHGLPVRVKYNIPINFSLN